jgi:hypothetical protein
MNKAIDKHRTDNWIRRGESMKKISWHKKTLALICAFACHFIVFCGTAAGYATLEKFTGEVMIKNAEEWLQPKTGMALYSGAKIVTKNGTAFILFKDGATMQVDPYSSIRAIDQVKSGESQSDEPTRIRRLRIMLGRAKYEEQPIATRQTRIEMPTAVAALRGTGGWFGADEFQASQGSLYEGNMDVTGIFDEIIPRILSLENALNSPTWSTSLNSAEDSDNPLANVQEIQTELQTFGDNQDPEIQKQIQQALSVIGPIFSGIQEKLEKAKNAEKQKETSDKAVDSATPETPSQVTETNKLASETNEAFMETAKESTKTDISLILETLKGNSQGISMALAAKERSDKALEIAEQAVSTATKAADLAGKATDEKQLETAASIARSAASTSRAAQETINTTNKGNQMLAQGNEEGLAKSGSLSDLADKTLAAAEKTSQLAQNALVLAQNEETSDTALDTARTAESSSKTIEESARKTSQAAQSVADNDPEADQLIEQTQEDEQAIDQMNQTLDEEIQKTASLVPETGDDGEGDEEDKSQQEEQPQEQETPVMDDTPPVFETEEPENPQERDFVDDDEPASPV